MASSFTCDIQKGQSFEDFVLKCAHHFDVSMREKSLDEPFEEIKPDNYYLNKKKTLLIKLKNLDFVLEKDVRIEQENYYNERIRKAKLSLNESKKLKKCYEKMLKDINQWIPPSENHTALKKFMIEQILESIEYDCETKYDKLYLKEKFKFNFKEYIKKEKEYLINEIKECDRRYFIHVKECELRNRWIRELKNSLKNFKVRKNLKKL